MKAIDEAAERIVYETADLDATKNEERLIAVDAARRELLALRRATRLECAKLADDHGSLSGDWIAKRIRKLAEEPEQTLSCTDEDMASSEPCSVQATRGE